MNYVVIQGFLALRKAVTTHVKYNIFHMCMISPISCLLKTRALRVDVSKDQRSGGQSSKFDFAYYLYIGRPRYYTYEIKVYLAKYCFVSKKFEYIYTIYFSS